MKNTKYAINKKIKANTPYNVFMLQFFQEANFS